MKKVLFLNDGMKIGGVEKALLTIFKYIDKSKYSIDILLPFAGDPWDDRIPKEINKRYIFTKRPEQYSHSFRKNYLRFLLYAPGILIQKLIIKKKYDVIIAFKDNMVFYLRGSKSLNLCWDHNDYSVVNNHFVQALKRKKTIKERMIQYFHLKTWDSISKIICVSKSCMNAYKNIIDSDKITYLYNPNDVEEILKLSQEKVNFNVNEDVINICSVGRLTEQKAYLRLLEVCKELDEDRLKYHLYIIGDGEQYEKLNEYIQQYNLNNVTLLGEKYNPFPYMKKCDLFVCSSVWESYGLVVAESIILGIPVLTTSCSGPKELLQDNEFGVVTENNPESLYSGIKEMLRNPNLLEFYKKKTKERASFFDMNIRMEEIEKMIDEGKS